MLRLCSQLLTCTWPRTFVFAECGAHLVLDPGQEAAAAVDILPAQHHAHLATSQVSTAALSAG